MGATLLLVFGVLLNGVLGQIVEQTMHIDDERSQNSVVPDTVSTYDRRRQIIAYKDFATSHCYLQDYVTTNRLDSNEQILYISNLKLTNHQVRILAGTRIAAFCVGFSTYFLQRNKPKYNHQLSEIPNDIPRQYVSEYPPDKNILSPRIKRQTPTGRRYRGQTQTQYLNFQNGNGKEGKAEAESTGESSRAIVSGSHGMGQAQSQSGHEGDCSDCLPGGYGSSGRPLDPIRFPSPGQAVYANGQSVPPGQISTRPGTGQRPGYGPGGGPGSGTPGYVPSRVGGTGIGPGHAPGYAPGYGPASGTPGYVPSPVGGTGIGPGHAPGYAPGYGPASGTPGYVPSPVGGTGIGPGHAPGYAPGYGPGSGTPGYVPSPVGGTGIGPGHAPGYGPASGTPGLTQQPGGGAGLSPESGTGYVPVGGSGYGPGSGFYHAVNHIQVPDNVGYRPDQYGSQGYPHGPTGTLQGGSHGVYIPGSGQPQQAPGADSTLGIVREGDSQAASSVTQDDKALKAVATSQGRVGSGTAQAQVSGTYTGSGSFNAQAMTGDDDRGAQSQVMGGKEGASSAAQGRGGTGQTQTLVELGSETGALKSGAQSSGWNHATNTEVNAGSQGGLADAQAKGPGSTNSQAQIGFKPYQKKGESPEEQSIPYRGGGSATAQSGTYSGQSETQVEGSYRYGISYTGGAQAGSGSKDGPANLRPGGNATRFKPIAVFTPFGEQRDFSLSNANATEVRAQLAPLNQQDTTTRAPRFQSTDPLPGYVPISSIESKNKDISRSGLSSAPSNSESRHTSEVSPKGGDGKYANVNKNSSSGQPAHGGKISHLDGNQGRVLSGGYKGASDANEEDQPEEEEYEDEEDEDYSEKEFQQGSYGISNYQPGQTLHQNLGGKDRNALQGGASRQQVVVSSSRKQDAHVAQASDSGRNWSDGDVLESGSNVPGSPSYTIPSGFRGRVTSGSGSSGTYARAPQGSSSQSQTVTLKPNYRNYQPHHMNIPVGVRSGGERSFAVGRNENNNQHVGNNYRNNALLRNGQNGVNPSPDSFVTVTKSVTGQLDNNGKLDTQGKKYTHTYYTKSSTCGYFTFSCNVVFGSNGRTKICKPNPPSTPDGTPCST